ncbi:MAG: hypothetical protein J0H94_03815 [Rhizobiales bacterium]|nr:hypothetical protein [Hyphomicrobiales bacterium]
MAARPVAARVGDTERTVVVHVGTIKTGTTYIQSLATKHADHLRAHGVYYPAEHGSEAHHDIAGMLARTELSQTAMPSSVRRSKLKHLLLSSEVFLNFDVGDLGRVRDLLPDRKVFAVAFLREPVGLLASWIQEMVKHGWIGSTDDAKHGEVIAEMFLRPVYDSVLRGTSVAEKLVGAFGPSQVLLVAFNNVLDAGQDLFRCMAEDVVGIPAPDKLAFDDANLNTRMTLEQQELNRLLNQTITRRGFEATIHVHLGMLRHANFDIGPFAPIRNYVRATRFRSREGVHAGIERRLADEFGDLFVNKAESPYVFHREHEGEIEWVDLNRFCSENPRAVTEINRIADAVIQEGQLVARQ